MQDRATRIIMLVVAVLLAILVFQPYVNTYLTSAREPRPVAARGDLAEFERTTIQVFETVAPSVVQVVACGARPHDGSGASRLRHGLRLGCGGPRGDERACGGERSLLRRPHGLGGGAAGRGGGARAELRSRRAAARQRRRPAAPDRDRHLRRPQGRAGGLRDRQPVRPRPDADHRHHQRPRAACRPAAGARSPT